MARTTRSTDHFLSARTDFSRPGTARFFARAARGHVETPRCGVGTVAGNKVRLDTWDDCRSAGGWSRKQTNRAFRRNARNVIVESEDTP